MKRRKSRRNDRAAERDQRRYPRDKDKFESKDSARNDISWYSRNPNLLVAAGSFPYPYRPGMTLDLGTTIGPAGSKFTFTVPGCMTLHWLPSVGLSETATDPASVLGKEMYARVRQVYSGSLDVDAPDFVMYVMALDSAFAYIAWLKRVFRVINAWSPENYFIPDGLLVGMGFSKSEILNLRAEKTLLWQLINDLVLQSHKFTVPASMDVFNRHYWMSDNVYTDADSINSQMYLFNPHALYRFAELPMPGTEDVASGLEMVLMPVYATHSTPLTVKDLYNYGVGLLQALVAWDDAYIINGYLRRAFEGDAQFTIDEIGGNEILSPRYEPEVLMQIENSRVLPYGERITSFSAFKVTQDVSTNAVISRPSYDVNGDLPLFTNKLGLINPILNIRSDSPTVADSTVASRLQAGVLRTLNIGTNWSVFIDSGTEIPLFWDVTVITNGQATQRVWQQMQYVNVSLGDTPSQKAISDSVINLANTMNVESYDWHPIGMIVAITPQGELSTFWTLCGDVHNLTTINGQSLQNLHRICLYSEFNSFGLIP